MKAVLPIPKFSKLQTPSRFFKVVFCQLTGNACTWLLTARQEVKANPEGCILGTVVLQDDSSDKSRRQTGDDRVLELGGQIKSNFRKIGQAGQSDGWAERGVASTPAAFTEDPGASCPRGTRPRSQAHGEGCCFLEQSLSKHVPLCVLERWPPIHVSSKSGHSETAPSPGK